MSRILLKSRSQIIDDLINAVVARTSLTDVNEAAVIRHLLTAVGAEIFTVYGQFTNLAALFDFQTAEGNDLDERAKEILGGTLTRNDPARAVGSLIFSRTTVGTVVNIPTGTICKSAEGTEYETTALGTITIAALNSGNVSARAVNIGEVGNTNAGVVTSFATKPPGVNSVTNNPFTGGTDAETDAQFRARIENFVQSLARSTVDGIESVLVGLEDVPSGKTIRFAHVYEPPNTPGVATIFIDDGGGTAATTAPPVVGETIISPALGGEEFLYTAYAPLLDNLLDASFEIYKNGTAMTLGTDYYMNWASGRIFFDPPLNTGDVITADYQYYTGLVALAQRVVDGDPTDRVTYPGYRAAGVDARVLTPTTRTIPVVAQLSVTSGFSTSAVATAVETEVINYINELGISADVIRNELIERIMATPGVYNVNLITPSTATGDQRIDDSEIARTDSAQVTIS